jgi:hypothetical protein
MRHYNKCNDWLSITIGTFWTIIAKWDENGYYQLHNDTIPDTVDTLKNFRTKENAEKYFYKEVRKACGVALRELEEIGVVE